MIRRHRLLSALLAIWCGGAAHAEPFVPSQPFAAASSAPSAAVGPVAGPAAGNGQALSTPQAGTVNVGRGNPFVARYAAGTPIPNASGAVPVTFQQDLGPAASGVVPALAEQEVRGETVPAPAAVSGQPTSTPPTSTPPTSMPPTSVSPPPVPDLAGAGLPIPQSTVFRLDELTGIAVTYNPILTRSRARIEMAKGERVQAGLYENPYMFTNNPQIFGGQTSFVNVGFRQNVIVKGKLRLEKAAADQEVRSQTADYRIERAELLTNVRRQYYKAVAAKHRLHMARHLAAIAQRAVGGARQLQQAGQGTLTDVLLLDTEYQRAEMRRQNAETTFRGELLQLQAVVGYQGLRIDDVEGTLFGAPPIFDEQDVRTFVAESSSYAERARADITKEQAELRRAEVDPYPDLQLGPHYNTGTIANSSQYWFTVEFQIPVWNLNQGNVRKQNAEVRQAIEQRLVMRNELNRRISELFAEHRAARERAERLRVEILPNAQETLVLVQDAYLKGLFNVNRLLKSQHNLASVSSDYFDAAEKSWDTAAELAGLLQLEQFP